MSSLDGAISFRKICAYNPKKLVNTVGELKFIARDEQKTDRNVMLESLRQHVIAGDMELTYKCHLP